MRDDILSIIFAAIGEVNGSRRADRKFKKVLTRRFSRGDPA
jgi:hypothetical protein